MTDASREKQMAVDGADAETNRTAPEDKKERHLMAVTIQLENIRPSNAAYARARERAALQAAEMENVSEWFVPPGLQVEIPSDKPVEVKPATQKSPKTKFQMQTRAAPATQNKRPNSLVAKRQSELLESSRRPPTKVAAADEPRKSVTPVPVRMPSPSRATPQPAKTPERSMPTPTRGEGRFTPTPGPVQTANFGPKPIEPTERLSREWHVPTTGDEERPASRRGSRLLIMSSDTSKIAVPQVETAPPQEPVPEPKRAITPVAPKTVQEKEKAPTRPPSSAPPVEQPIPRPVSQARVEAARPSPLARRV